MSIYIKGMEMPDEGLYYIQDGYIRKYKGGGGTVRAYKIAEVPEPHGRLIDADVCIDYIRNNNQHAWETLAYAPTVIERSDK